MIVILDGDLYNIPDINKFITKIKELKVLPEWIQTLEQELKILDALKDFEDMGLIKAEIPPIDFKEAINGTRTLLNLLKQEIGE